MESTKIQLSTEELQLMNNDEWILTKNRVIEKIVHAFGLVGMQMQTFTNANKDRLPGELLRSNPKVSKGEKYLGLPYIILDFPRIFEKENILAIRTLFWWGHYYSVSLHVSGKYLETVCEKFLENCHLFREDGLYISMAGDEWNHDLNSSDYHMLATMSEAELRSWLINKSFLKISARVGLGELEKIENEIYRIFQALLKLTEV